MNLQKKHGVPVEEVIPKIDDIFKNADLIISHSISFDLGQLQCEYNRLGKSFPARVPTFCSCIDHTIRQHCQLPFPNLTSHDPSSIYSSFKPPKLQELYRVLFNEDVIIKHNSEDDCRVLLHCLRKLKEIGKFDPYSKIDPELLS